MVTLRSDCDRWRRNWRRRTRSYRGWVMLAFPSLFLFLGFSSSPIFHAVPFVRLYSAQRRTNFPNPPFDRAHSDRNLCLALSREECLLLTCLPPSLFSHLTFIFFSLVSLFLSLSHPSGEAEGEDERRTQQASLWHGGQAAVRVQREAAAPSEGEDGRPGREGDLLRLRRQLTTSNHFYLNLLNQLCWELSPSSNQEPKFVSLFPQIHSWCQVCSLTSLPSRKWRVKHE